MTTAAVAAPPARNQIRSMLLSIPTVYSEAVSRADGGALAKSLGSYYELNMKFKSTNETSLGGGGWGGGSVRLRPTLMNGS